MEYKIEDQGVFATLNVRLSEGEEIKAESGAMVSMDANVSIDSKMEGGLLGGLGRMLAGEKLFLQTLKASHQSAEVLLAPPVPGSIEVLELTVGDVWNVHKDGFFAGDSTIAVSTKMQNLAKGLFSGAGFFVVKVSGKGKVFINSFGGIRKIKVEEGSEYIVDNNHLVAWKEGVDFKMEKAASGWISSITSGEGLVAKFRGPCEVYIQTRNAASFGGWLKSFIPLKK